MGGFGSGRRSGSGRDTWNPAALGVNPRLHKTGCLWPGWRGGWQWTSDGERVAWISLHAEADCVHLSYRVRIGAGDGEDVVEIVRIVRVPRRFGGNWPFFIFSGVVNGITCSGASPSCKGKDVIPLPPLLSPRPYQPEQKHLGSGLGRVNKIRRRLGSDPDKGPLFPRKPKGMWRQTYQQLCEQAFEAEMLADEGFALNVERLLTRIEKSNQTRRFRR